MSAQTTEPACPHRQRLKEYLSGWIGEDQTLEIEEHLTDCSACEQTIRELEAEPDTLLESLRADPAVMSKGQAARGDVMEDELVANAIQRVTLLMEESSAGELNWEVWQPPTEDLGAYTTFSRAFL